MRKFIKLLLFLFLSLGIVASLSLWGYQELKEWGERPVQLTEPKEVTLKRGMSLESLSRELEEAGLVPHHLYYRLWVRLFSSYRGYQAGPYRFEGNTSPRMIDETIRSGKIYQPVVLEVAIPEGFTKNQIIDRAVASKIGGVEELESVMKSEALRNQFPDLPEKSIEGYLFPATYRFTKIPSPKEFVELLVKTFFTRLPNDYENSLEPFELSLHEAVILASLIERETQRDEERNVVSEVIHNRLSKGVALAIDASIIYGIPDFDGNLRRRHLEDKTNLYNTRKHRGLPPGPICSPGEASLRAVGHPTNLNYWYYVVDAEDFSKHRFARTLKEHNKNVRAFWKAKKKADKERNQE